MFSRSRVYLDWAAAAPVHPHAREAFSYALASFGNPSSPHAEGRAARAILEKARADIALLTQVKPEAVLFTSGATEANALAVEGYIRALVNKGRALKDMHVLYLPTAHASVYELMQRLAKDGVKTETIAYKNGAIEMDAFRAQIRPETVLVSIEVIAGETGVRTSTRLVRQVLDEAHKEGRERIVLHADASQLPLIESIERTRLACDLMTLDAAKVGGVRGIGALIAPVTIPLAPIIEGGRQEREVRSGTQVPALAAAFAMALKCTAKTCESFAESARAARAKLVEKLLAFSDAVVNEGKEQAPHILNVSFPNIDTDYLVALLDAKGFSVSTKSACETDAVGSRVVLAETADEKLAASTLRISWGPSTRPQDLERFQKALAAELDFLHKNRIMAS
ncbi:MAG: cysteine desulfurase [Parcubacteria bacterium C7867-001]|nr:MAG: cysteine desulfurase [Parcubacteria bacterium C7867-001]